MSFFIADALWLMFPAYVANSSAVLLAGTVPIDLGKNFSDEKSANGKEYIINEALAKELLKDGKHTDYDFLLGKHFGFDFGSIWGGKLAEFGGCQRSS